MTGQAAAEEVSRKQLNAISADISAAERRMQDTDSERSSAQRELEQAEKALAETHARIDELQAERDKADATLTTLEQHHAQLTDEYAAQRKALAAQLAALYRLGQQPRLKILLEGGDPTKLERYQHYLSSINDERRERLEALARLDAEISTNRAQATAQRQQLDDLIAKLDARRQHLAEQQHEREQIVARLDARHADQQARLNDLRADRDHVETLLKQMERELAQAQAKREAAARRQARRESSQQLTEAERTAEPATGNSSRRTGPAEPAANAARASVHHADKDAASARWPVNGRLVSRFGQGDGVDQNGVLIAAQSGTPVRAAAGGQVVFANWMRGFGYLVILAHDHGILTLYAHNQRLAVATGDRVERGATIATVGNSGGRSSAALYFEVRRKGQPIDPSRWTASR